MTCDDIRDLLTEALYDELGSRRKLEFDNHIAACESCRTEYEGLKRTLALMNERVRIEPTDAGWKAFDRRLDAMLGVVAGQAETDGSAAGGELKTGPPEFTGVTPKFIPAWAYGIAALLLVTFGVYMGRTLFNGHGTGSPSQGREGITELSPSGGPGEATGTADIPVPGGSVKPGPAETIASTDRDALSYLERSRNLLLGLTNLGEQQTATVDLRRHREVSRELYNQGNVLAVALNRPSQQQLRQLVQNLQIILLQLSNMGLGDGRPAIELVRQSVDSKSILLKINLEAIRAGLNDAGDAGPGDSTGRSL